MVVPIKLNFDECDGTNKGYSDCLLALDHHSTFEAKMSLFTFVDITLNVCNHNLLHTCLKYDSCITFLFNRKCDFFASKKLI